MKKFIVPAVVAFLMLFCSHISLAQSGEELKTLKEEIKSLKEGQTAIQKDLQEIKKLLQTKQAPPARPEFKETVVNIDNNPFKGEKNAKLVLIEFSDYQ